MQYIYLIKCQQYYKIGIANDVQSRLAQLSTGNPFELEVLAVYGFKNANAVEVAIHQRYSGSRKRGEWFFLDDHDLVDFEQICQLLGGEKEIANALPTDEDIQTAEEIQSEVLDSEDKLDFEKMFADGWRLAIQDSRGRYWNWRNRKNGQDKCVYGGTISSLPLPIDEMRRRYGG